MYLFLGSSDAGLWIGICFYIIAAQLSMTACFESAYAICPKEYVGIAVTCISFGFLFIGSVFSEIFGIIADATNYDGSVALLFAFGFVGFVICVTLTIRKEHAKPLFTAEGKGE